MLDQTTTTRTEAIARLNDRCRQGYDRTARIVVTSTCLATFSNESIASQAIAQAMLLQNLRGYSFPSDVPERDRGDFVMDGTRVYFRIDYYDTKLAYGSEDPTDASVTRRVLTMMLREDL